MEEHQATQSAASLLAEIEVLGRSGRSSRKDVSFPLLAFGLVDLVGAPLVLVVGREHLGPFMLPATALAGVLCAWRYRAVGRRAGAETAVWPWIVVTVIMALVAALCSFLGRETGNRMLNLPGPFLSHIAGFAVIALWAQSTLLLGIIGGLVAVAVFAVVYTDGDVAIALQLAGWSAIMLVGGAAFRLRAGAAG